VVDACGVVVAATAFVRQGVVGVIDLLELAGAFGAFWRVRGYAIGVGFQGLPSKSLAKWLLNGKSS
jgi:hypothetical protein